VANRSFLTQKKEVRSLRFGRERQLRNYLNAWRRPFLQQLGEDEVIKGATVGHDLSVAGLIPNCA
jgi:hypothetical protein